MESLGPDILGAIPMPNAARDKWGTALQAGFQVVPNILIQAHRELNLDPVDVLVLLNLNMHWWEAANLPYPKITTIADRIGVGKRTIERRIHKMQKAGLIERLPAETLGGGVVNRFRLTGLVEQLSRLAEQAVLARGRYRSEAVPDQT